MCWPRFDSAWGEVRRVVAEGPSNVSTRTRIQIQIQLRMRIGNRTCAFEFSFFTLWELLAFSSVNYSLYSTRLVVVSNFDCQII